jgi:hypothetical protein
VVVPAKPVAGQPIETAWGELAHDTAVAMDIQSGVASVAVAGAVSGTATVTFPRPFASAPTVVCALVSTSVAYLALVITAPTATAVGLGLTHKTAGTSFTDTRQVAWIAYGPRA